MDVAAYNKLADEADPTKAFLLRVYDDFDDHKVGDVVEIFAVVSNDTDDKRNYGKVSAPIELHALKIFTLKHNNPLLSIDIPLDVSKGFSEKGKTTKESFLAILTKLLFGDALAAEYLLIFIVSRIVKQKQSLAEEKLCVNFFNIPRECGFGKKLFLFLQRVLTKVGYFPMTAEKLNPVSLMPGEGDRYGKMVQGGPLEPCPETNLIIDETELDFGQLNEQGRKNLSYFKFLINQECNQYQYLRFENPSMDAPCLVLSCSRAEIFSDVQIRFPSNISSDRVDSVFGEVNTFLDSNPNYEKGVRQYLTLAQKRKPGFSLEAFEHIKSRRAYESPIQCALLRVLVNIMVSSNGGNLVTSQDWERARDLESRRNQSLQNEHV